MERVENFEIDYRSEVDKINANARVFERAIFGSIKCNAPSIVVPEVGASLVDAVRVRGFIIHLIVFNSKNRVEEFPP